MAESLLPKRTASMVGEPHKPGEVIAAKDLECHFKWNLQEGADKLIPDVIRNVEDKLEIEPLREAPYLCLLAYLYTMCPKKQMSYPKAYKFLDKADEINAKIKEGRLSSGFIACQFVANANRLNIDAIRSTVLDPQDHQDRVKKLLDFWNNPDEDARNALRASVLLVKSLSCLRFGPSKYRLGAGAAGEAISLSTQHFHTPYLQAYQLARWRRYVHIKSKPVDEELTSWNSALGLAQQNHVDVACLESCIQLAVIQVHYAEAIVNDESKSGLAESLADEAKALLTDSAAGNQDLLENNFRIFLKCGKVYRLLKKFEKWKEMLAHLEPLKERTTKPQLLYDLSLEAKYNKNYSEHERLLKRAKDFADSPGHIWVDLALLWFQCSHNSEQRLSCEEVLLEYDDLIAKYEENRRAKGVLYYYKGVYSAHQRKNEIAMQLMVKAVQLVPSVRYSIPMKYRKNMLDKIVKWRYPTEWVAWYLDNIIDDSDDASQVQTMFKDAIDQGSDFALEHYAVNRIRADQFHDAEQLLRRLNDTCDRKTTLLSQALLGQVEMGQVHEGCIGLISECLSLGCKDACRVAVSLLGMINQDDQELMQCIMREWAQPGTSPILTPFSTSLYKMCAQIEHVLGSDTAFFINEDLDHAGYPSDILSFTTKFLRCNETDDKLNEYKRRKHRLSTSKLFIADPTFATPALTNSLFDALMEAKDSLDRHFNEFLRDVKAKPEKSTSEFYPHGFTYAIKKLKKDKDYIVEQNRLNSLEANTVDELKMHEMNSIISLLSDTELADLEEKCKAKLPKVLEKFLGPSGPILRDVLAAREARILFYEGPWIVLWRYMVNNRRHSGTATANPAELNLKLAQLKNAKKDVRAGWNPPTDAYQMMHRAVEFVEYTAILIKGACEA